MEKECIICIDDEPIVLKSLSQELKKDPFFKDLSIITSSAAEKVPGLVNELLSEGFSIPVVISDQRMPVMTGDALLLKLHEILPDTRKILLTGFSDLSAVVNLVNHGALYRFLSKPWYRQDLLLTIEDACSAWRQEKQINCLTQKIENITFAMVAALENANHYFDEGTGSHLRRISKLSGYIAETAGLDPGFVHMVTIYAPLHDIGKVGIEKAIIFKPGKLTREEFQRVKEHVRIGHLIINNEAIDLIARNIVLYHHEKWNGKGYLEGLSGDAIPPEARIVSIADVFDALMNERVYKKAFSLEETMEIMVSERGISFDPDLLDPFLEKMKILRYPEDLN